MSTPSTSTGSTRPVTVVVGASRGLGLELARQLHAQYAASSDPAERSTEVIATMRTPAQHDLPSDVRIEQLDILSDASVAAFAAKVPRIDTLLLNAAVLRHEPGTILKAQADDLRWHLESNLIGIHRVLQALYPALLPQSEEEKGKRRVVFFSSSSASMYTQIGFKSGLGGPYAISKAATNMLAVQAHNELGPKGIAVALIHPGWIATEMGGPKGMPIPDSAAGVLKELAKVDLDIERGPRYTRFDGEAMPW